MPERNKKYLLHISMLMLAAVMVIPFIASCGKSTDGTVNGFNSQITVANLSPDVSPVNLYINNVLQSSSDYRYPTVSSYFFLNTVDQQLQIRSDTGLRSPLFTTDSVPRRNAKYTLFVTGVKADSTTVKYVFVVDTSTLPAVGRGKIRFINASPRSVAFDVYANGSLIYKKIAFNNYSPFVELPVGNYDFRMYATGDQSIILKEINPVTIQDGKLYTLYSYGIIGRTDTAAFNTGIITNK